MARRNPELMDRTELGERMLQWHGGQDDPVYAVGSFYVGNKIYPDPEIIEDALANLEMELSDNERMLSGETVMVRRQGRQVDLKTFAGYTDAQLEENIDDLSEIVDALREQMAEDEWIEGEDFTENRRWTRAYINSLPDSHFFYVEHSKADHKDREGRSHPLSVRHFPYKDRSGKVSVLHVKDALSRIPQSYVSERAKTEARRKAERVYEQHGGYRSNARGRPMTALDYVNAGHGPTYAEVAHKALTLLPRKAERNGWGHVEEKQIEHALRVIEQSTYASREYQRTLSIRKLVPSSRIADRVEALLLETYAYEF